jgi:hypothetical protein
MKEAMKSSYKDYFMKKYRKQAKNIFEATVGLQKGERS